MAGLERCRTCRSELGLPGLEGRYQGGSLVLEVGYLGEGTDGQQAEEQEADGEFSVHGLRCT